MQNVCQTHELLFHIAVSEPAQRRGNCSLYILYSSSQRAAAATRWRVESAIWKMGMTKCKYKVDALLTGLGVQELTSNSERLIFGRRIKGQGVREKEKGKK